MGFTKNELTEFLNELVELAGEENKTRAVLVKERFISDFEKSYEFEKEDEKEILYGVIRWLSYPVDDAIRTAFEWNDEFLEEAEEKVENAGNYDEYVKESEYLKELRAEEKLLNAMFDRTRYGKRITEAAEKIAGEIVGEIISDWEKTGRVDEGVKKLMEAVSRETEILQEQEERTERSR